VSTEVLETGSSRTRLSLASAFIKPRVVPKLPIHTPR